MEHGWYSSFLIVKNLHAHQDDLHSGQHAESERPWGRPVTSEHIQHVCRTFPSLRHLDLTATADWDASHLRAARFLQGVDLNAQHPEAFHRLEGLPAVVNVQIINMSKDYPEGRSFTQPGSLDTLCRFPPSLAFLLLAE